MPTHVRNPRSLGEQQLLMTLEGLGDPQLHIWAGLDYLPGVRDVDLLLYHQGAGIFVVEVKAVPLRAILSYGFNYCEIEGRQPDLGPAMQAHDAKDTLTRDYLAEHGSVPKFIGATACWPKIYREEWNRRWDDPAVTKEYSLRMLFREDLEGESKIFVDRLKYIWANPPVRAGQRVTTMVDGEKVRRVHPFAHDEERLVKLQQLLAPRAKPRMTPSDRERLAQLEEALSAKLAKRYPAQGSTRIVFTGAPGTGKTFRLLKVGMQHSYTGKKVLFSCFNKTLGADIRRLLSLSERASLCDYKPEVLDVFELARRCFFANSLAYIEGKDQSAWGKMVVDELKASPDPAIERYDTVLVDEAQDMSDWQLTLIEMHAKKEASFLVARGDGQELYNHDQGAADWLKAFETKGATAERLTQNFRNTKNCFLGAQCFYSYYPGGKADLHALVGKLLKSARLGVQGDLGFEREGGEVIDLVPILDDDVDYQDGYFQGEVMAAKYKEIVEAELDDLLSDGNCSPLDLLVLVPNSEGARTIWLREAVAQLAKQKTLEYVDLTQEEQRRVCPTDRTVRLCTFHSSRGLEAQRVIVFGLESLDRLCNDIGADPAKLGFVILSRALFLTKVFAPASVIERAQSTSFLRAIRAAYFSAIAKS